jgi:energy-coupling factor transporter ATP-binding protein EcfA2
MGNRLIGSLSRVSATRRNRPIIHEPDVIILDEPTVGLDPNQIREIRTLIRDLGRDHSLILSTHILPEVEAVCDRVQILHRGEVVFNDTIAGLKRFRGGQTLQLGLRSPPPLDEIGRDLCEARRSIPKPICSRPPTRRSRSTDDLVRAQSSVVGACSTAAGAGGWRKFSATYPARRGARRGVPA